MPFGVLFTETCPIVYKDNDPEYLKFIDVNGKSVPLHVVGWLVSLIFTILASVVTLYLIKQHWKYYTKPDEQRYIIRLLLIVPIYTILNWLAYIFVRYRYSLFFITIRDGYQAYAIINFFNLLLHSLGKNDDERLSKLRSAKIKSIRVPLPFFCLTYNPIEHRNLLKRFRFGILQYVFIVCTITMVTFILQVFGKYCNESFSLKFPKIYLIAIQSLSGLVADICMNMLFKPARKVLKDDYPWFLRNICVNVAFFLVTYQGATLGLFILLGFIKETKYWTAHDISTGIQAVLVSVEFLILSLIQMKAFRYKDYRPNSRKQPTPILQAMKDSLIPIDLFKEFIHALKYIYCRLTNKPLPTLWPNDKPSLEKKARTIVSNPNELA
ncbi:13705_t:CDS:2 [Funneliformis geosporum]|uniref:16597_t:CDS:1 n=1 Tax=Funneliformis geosporum TaxID=1117311 RepID=A0A9W4WLX7_9GLOM|nr:13705_t:CDS:2 [Funneliformis geosporum]CAI2163710.1 16597_t:CDS:2 [Funneliformis geosporum]